ncbi:hypothetical protein, partial [Pseudomonas fragi]|uniref:hypothetical protein n=1 Tax=Pseudomonas fragi TaxID=296 RepID=UPI001960F05F
MLVAQQGGRCVKDLPVRMSVAPWQGPPLYPGINVIHAEPFLRSFNHTTGVMIASRHPVTSAAN